MAVCKGNKSLCLNIPKLSYNDVKTYKHKQTWIHRNS